MVTFYGHLIRRSGNIETLPWFPLITEKEKKNQAASASAPVQLFSIDQWEWMAYCVSICLFRGYILRELNELGGDGAKSHNRNIQEKNEVQEKWPRLGD